MTEYPCTICESVEKCDAAKEIPKLRTQLAASEATVEKFQGYVNKLLLGRPSHCAHVDQWKEHWALEDECRKALAATPASNLQKRDREQQAVGFQEGMDTAAKIVAMKYGDDPEGLIRFVAKTYEADRHAKGE